MRFSRERLGGLESQPAAFEVVVVAPRYPYLGLSSSIRSPGAGQRVGLRKNLDRLQHRSRVDALVESHKKERFERLGRIGRVGVNDFGRRRGKLQVTSLSQFTAI
jgi:hypothetical protein